MTMAFILPLAAFGVCYLVGHAVVSLPIRRWLADFGFRQRIHMICPLCGEETDFTHWERTETMVVCPSCHQSTSAGPLFTTDEGIRRFHYYARHPFRWFIQLLECPACLSTWLGLVFGAAVAWQEPWPWLIANALFTAAYLTGTSYVLARLTNLIPAPEED